MRTLTRTLALSRTRRPVTWWYPYISDPAVETYAGQAILSMTYDDGRLDNYTTALLLHEKYKIPATFFIIGDRMGWTREAAIAANYMHTLEVQNTHRRGIEIGSHSYSHPTLTELDAAEIAYEFSESKSVLEALLTDEDVTTLAVPGSQYDQTVRDIVAALPGYEGVRVYNNLQNDIPPTDVAWLKTKLSVGATVTLETVQAAIQDAITNNKWCVLMLHRIIAGATGSDTTPEVLESILEYVASLDPADILATSFRTGLRMALSAAD